MARNKITTSSTAEYFAKNLQQVGFSSGTKAVLTTLKEAMDNSLDACEENHILPEIHVEIEKLGSGSLKNMDKIRVRIEDNGPGIDVKNIPQVFGEYLASSKFGRGRCSRGQQGIGISAATTWAMQTSASGVKVRTKLKDMKKAVSCEVLTDLKKNKGLVKNKKSVDWEKSHGTSVEFEIDGRLQINGDAGILNYIKGNVLLNPHLSISYQLPDQELVKIDRVSDVVPQIPAATDPHPHTMKLGEFISHAQLFGRTSVKEWLKKGFSRISEAQALAIWKETKLPKSLFLKPLSSFSDQQLKLLYSSIQNAELRAPPTNSVMSIGEDALALSIHRIGDLDYFSVVTRKPVICDFKPVQVEVAIARLKETRGDSENPVQVLRFANRVPLQFDKSSCAIVKAISSINWKSYGLRQSKGQMPVGPYVIAVSVVSPFIKFKNASKETIDASDELVDELRRALMKGGQKLSRHLRREKKADELEAKIQHIEKFSPILVETLCRILKASDKRRSKAEEGLRKILGREEKLSKKELSEAEERLSEHLSKNNINMSQLRDPQFEGEAAEPEFADLGLDKLPKMPQEPIKKRASKGTSTKPSRKTKKATPVVKKKTKAKKPALTKKKKSSASKKKKKKAKS